MHRCAQAGSPPALYSVRPRDAGCNPWGRSAAPTPRSPSRRAPLPHQAGCLTLASLDIGNRPSAQPNYHTPRNQSARNADHRPTRGRNQAPRYPDDQAKPAGPYDAIARPMLRGRPPASPEPTQPGRRADERGEPLSCSPPLDHRAASTPAPCKQGQASAQLQRSQTPTRPR